MIAPHQLLKQLRIIKQYRPDKIAQELGISVATFRTLENGKTYKQVHILKWLAALDLTITEANYLQQYFQRWRTYSALVIAIDKVGIKITPRVKTIADILTFNISTDILIPQVLESLEEPPVSIQSALDAAKEVEL